MNFATAPAILLGMEPDDLRPPRGPAWRSAEEYGLDMSLVESTLRRTPEQRIRLNEHSVAMVLELREAMKRRNA